MNENLNLVEILKDCPKGTKLYSTVYGGVKFDGIENGSKYPVWFVKSDGDRGSVTAQGLVFTHLGGDCTLFPSKEQRDWSKFKAKKPRFSPKTLRPFDKVLRRDTCTEDWECDFFSHIYDGRGSYPYVTTTNANKFCIPYNDDTKHLVGTTEEAPEYYRYWEV